MAKKKITKKPAAKPAAKKVAKKPAAKKAASKKAPRARAASTARTKVPAHPAGKLPKLAATTPAISYSVTYGQPAGHSFFVVVRISNLQHESVDLQFPAWTPGSYKIREFARNISDFEAEIPSESGDWQSIDYERLDKDTFRVHCGPQREVMVGFEVYAFEFSVRTPHADDTHAFFQPTNLLPYVVGHTDAPCTMAISLSRELTAAGWEIFCPLPLLTSRESAQVEDLVVEGSKRKVFVAPNYDVLADSPVEMGPHQTRTFAVDGKRHEIVCYSWIGNYDLDLWQRDFETIVRQAKRTFGDLPYDNYMFIIHAIPGARGGLEHLNSQVSAWPAMEFGERKKYEDFLSLISHEYFHTWNVKRIRPEILGPFDYSREQYTPSLWIMEGLTVYYEWLQLVRAGVVTRERYFAALSEELNRADNRPGNGIMTLEESSYLAWTKLYLADENFLNTGISYYLKGGLVGLLLDLRLRELSGHQVSLDDVMRSMYADYGWPKPGFPEGIFEERCMKLVPDKGWQRWFDHHLRSTEELDFTAALASVGLLVERDVQEEARPDGTRVKPKDRPYMGWELAESNGKITVSALRTGSPAFVAGVSAKDELLAINKRRIATITMVENILKMAGIGGSVDITAFRGDRLVNVVAQVGSFPAGRLRVREAAKVSAAQQRARDAWLSNS